ncbi:DUF6932 family protein [Bradyrhizobium diazoefficiens]
MSIPDFERDGLLPPGRHECTGQEFISRFCVGGTREHFEGAITDVLDFAMNKGAVGVLMGGSFITNTEAPKDFDCVIVFSDEAQIPDRTERVEIEGTKLDVFFCALSQTRILGGFIRMFSETRKGKEVGVIYIDLWDEGGQALWRTVYDVDEDTLEIIRRMYFDRHLVERNYRDKALITVHGIRTYAEWNAEIAHIASSNGWIFAPFTYGFFDISQLAKAKERNLIVDKFRAHIHDIRDRYGCDVSVIAHSFGTYVVMKYLLGFDLPPVQIDTLILTGSIIDENLDLEKLKGKAAVVVNEVAPNDDIVQWAQAGTLWGDDLIGASGAVGFKNVVERLDQRTCEIFDHNNVIRRDVVSQRWMPLLEAGVGRCTRELSKLVSARNAAP